MENEDELEECHNPYFNRWFSAMHLKGVIKMSNKLSQSLF